MAACQEQYWIEALNAFDQGAFFAKNNMIRYANTAARRQQILPGMHLSALRMEAPWQDDGVLVLPVYLYGKKTMAKSMPVSQGRLYVMEREAQTPDAALLARIAGVLREPVQDILSATETLTTDTALRKKSQLQRSIHRLSLALCNLTDLSGFLSGEMKPIPEETDFISFFYEIFEYADTLCQPLDIHVSLRVPGCPVTGGMDRGKVERAVWNLLANALSYAKAGSTVQGQLTATAKQVTLRISQLSARPASSSVQHLCSRYADGFAPGDEKEGVGLGLSLVRQVAQLHGGSLLMAQREESNWSVAMSLAKLPPAPARERKPACSGTYSGELDHGLLELSGVLPASAFFR